MSDHQASEQILHSNIILSNQIVLFQDFFFSISPRRFIFLQNLMNKR